MHCPTAHSSALSWLKSPRKYCTSLRPSPSRQARPTMKATVPVPPDSPVVSVSRKRGRRSSSGASPRQVASAPTSPSPWSASHSRRTSTGPNGVSSSAQFAGSRPAVPPPPPPPPPPGGGGAARAAARAGRGGGGGGAAPGAAPAAPAGGGGGAARAPP